MNPISAFSSGMPGIMPNVDMMPEANAMPGAGTQMPTAANLAAMTMETPSLSSIGGAGMQGTSGIEMPSELAAPMQAGGLQGSGDTFSSMLSQMVSDVNAKQAAAGQSVSALQSGQSVPLHQAVISMEEANVSFQLMVEVRNRLLDGYQEIMRMQV
jgi:flagellar hook-basal body complex protein FliE